MRRCSRTDTVPGFLYFENSFGRIISVILLAHLSEPPCQQVLGYLVLRIPEHGVFHKPAKVSMICGRNSEPNIFTFLSGVISSPMEFFVKFRQILTKSGLQSESRKRKICSIVADGRTLKRSSHHRTKQAMRGRTHASTDHQTW